MTPERLWQIENLKAVQAELDPKRVLDVGYAEGLEDTMNVWGHAVVETVDPHTDKATHTCRFEDRDWPGFDLISLNSVFDYFTDPLEAARHLAKQKTPFIIQSRLNTYRNDIYKAALWVPTKKCVKTVLKELLGPEEIKFYGNSMFMMLRRSH